jgi:hypothetical protein
MPIRIDAGDFLLALDSHAPELENYLDLRTGAIIPVTDYVPSDPEYAEFEEHRDDGTLYRLIDPVPSRQGWDWMDDFAGDVADPRAREALLRSIEGSGAFGRFKRTLHAYPELRDAWFRFQEERLLEYAREWLADEGIDAELTELPARPHERL